MQIRLKIETIMNCFYKIFYILYSDHFMITISTIRSANLLTESQNHTLTEFMTSGIDHLVIKAASWKRLHIPLLLNIKVMNFLTSTLNMPLIYRFDLAFMTTSWIPLSVDAEGYLIWCMLLRIYSLLIEFFIKNSLFLFLISSM